MRRAVLVVALPMLFAIACNSMQPEEMHAKGEQLLAEGKPDKAYALFKKAARREPQTAKYSWAAARAAPNRNAAFLHATDAWNAGMKDQAVLLVLARTAFHTTREQKREYALGLFNQLPQSRKTGLLEGEIYFQLAEYDAALGVWKTAFERSPTPVLAVRIAQAHENKGDLQTARSFLEQCRTRGLLSSEGYVELASLYHATYAFKEIEPLMKEAAAKGEYGRALQVHHARLRFLNQDLDGALQLLRPLLTPVDNAPPGIVERRARLLSAYIHAARNHGDSITALIKLPSPSPKMEHTYYRGLQMAIAGSDSGVVLLDEARKALGKAYPIVTLAHARAAALKQQFEVSARSYSTLPPVFLRSPHVLVEYATALSRTGRDDDALRILGVMHMSAVFTRASLELFRDLTFKKNLLDKSQAAQAILSKHYGEDANVRWNGGLIALKKGNIDSARKIFTRLAQEFPDEARFEKARIATYLLAQDYERVIAECRTSARHRQQLAGLEARALANTGKPDEAEQAYRQAVKSGDDKLVAFEFAQFLMEHEKSGEAVGVYESILDSLGPTQDMTTAMLLNNMAWAQLQIKGADMNAAVEVAAKAHGIAPDVAQIVDTYATALSKAGKHKRCIELLSDNSVVRTEPALMLHLASAFEQSGDINAAVREYREVVAYKGPPGQVPLPVGLGEVEKRIARLTSDEK